MYFTLLCVFISFILSFCQIFNEHLICASATVDAREAAVNNKLTTGGRQGKGNRQKHNKDQRGQ